MPQTVTRGPESTTNVSSATQERYVDREIARLTPDVAPLTVLMRQVNKKSVDHFKPEWFEKDLPARWDQVNNGAGYVSGATDIVVDNASYFSNADIVKVPRTAEEMRVTAVNTGTNTLTVVRGVGSTAAAALLDNDDLLIIGNAYAEGAERGIPKSHQPTNPFNYTQIFRTPFGQTRTESKTRHYVNGSEKELAAEKLSEHMLDIERAFWFGERNIDSTDTSAPRRLMGGVLYWATSNITDFGATATEAEMESFMQNVTTYTGSGEKRAFFASGLWISQLSQIAAGRLQTVSDKNATFGISVVQWITGHGTLNIIKNRLFENGPGGVGYGGYAAALDVGKLTYYQFADDNTKLRKNIQTPGVDGYVHEYLTECSLGFKNPALHGIAKGLS